MKKYLLAAFTLLITYQVYGCGRIFDKGCDNPSDLINNSFILDYSRYYDGIASCAVPTNDRFTFYDDKKFPVAGITFTITFYSSSNGNHQVRIVTDQGAQNASRTSVTKLTGNDGEDWYLQVYSYTFPDSSTATLDIMDFRVKQNFRLDFMSVDIERDSLETNEFTYTNNQNRIVNFTTDHLAYGTLEALTEEFDLRIGSNTTMTLSHVPPVADPDVTVACDSIQSFNFTVDPDEPGVGSDSFSVNCLSGENSDGDALFYEIVNNTAKSYCFPIEFSIDLQYGFHFKDTVKSINYSDTYQVRTKFQ